MHHKAKTTVYQTLHTMILWHHQKLLCLCEHLKKPNTVTVTHIEGMSLGRDCLIRGLKTGIWEVFMKLFLNELFIIFAISPTLGFVMLAA